MLLQRPCYITRTTEVSRIYQAIVSRSPLYQKYKGLQSDVWSSLSLDRSDVPRRRGTDEIVEGLIDFLDNHNALVQLFRTARDKYLEANILEFKVKLYNVVVTREYELPTAESIGAIVFGETSSMENDFNLIVEQHSRKNFLSDDNKGRMIEKSFDEIQGTFLMKIQDNTFNGIIRENAFKHINNFIEVVGPLKVKGLSQDRFRLSVFPISLARAASEWFKKDCIGSVTTWEDMVEKFVQKFYQLFDDNEEMEADEDNDPDDIAEIFKIKGNLFDFETPVCKAFNDFNYLLKIDTDLLTFDIQGIKTYEEYELNNNMTGDLEEPWSDKWVPYQQCDHICEPYHFKNEKTKWPTCSSDIDKFCNGGELPGMVEALMHKAKVKESWGDATPDVIKFCAWLKSSFEIFHKLDHDVLVKLEECWWKVNAHEITPFTRWETYGRGPYTNIKTEKTYDPYLDINSIFGRNYGANNVGDTQDCQERKEEHKKYTESSKPAHDPSICQVRRFEMIKYSFDADDEYVSIKEHECSDHSKTNIDACQAYREL
ncbi:hypothetical protein Tco_1093066, partial [Tanacetum coccineum]